MTKEQFIDDKLANPHAESRTGHHFIQTYNCNKYEFYLKYVLGLEPLHTHKALVFGGVWHDACEYFDLTDDYDGMLGVFKTLLEHRSKEYETPTDYINDLARGPKMLYEWVRTWRDHDRNTYDYVAVEPNLSAETRNGYTVTGRLDRVMRNKTTGKIEILERKTTGRGATYMFQSVDVQDQATGYLWLWSKTHPEDEVMGVVPDIMYNRGSVIQAVRPGIVTRSKVNLVEYELNVGGLYNEMNQKIKALREGYPVALLFPRNGKDMAYFGKHDYADIYHMTLKPGQVPAGFKVNEARLGFFDDLENE
jgi:hypothetical protein